MNDAAKLLSYVGVVAFIVLAGYFGIDLTTEELGSDDEVKVWFFDVGQGDAHLIVVPGGTQVLIDGGPDQTVLQKLGAVMPYWDRTIEAIVLTHPHDDHVAGLVEVMKRYHVEKVYITGVLHTAPNYIAFLEALRDSDAETIIVDQPIDLQLGSGIELRFLYPLESYAGERVEELNNTSIVTMLDYGLTEVLFTGDLEEMGEAKLVRSGLLQDIDVYKAGHHGSSTSSSEVLLEVAKPEIVFIPVADENSYGHPSAWTLLKLKNIGAEIFRSDLHGDVLLTTDGRTYEVESRVPFLSF